MDEIKFVPHEVDPLEPDPMSVKVCGNCDGKGYHSNGHGFARMCQICKGSRRYGYLADGSRVAYSARLKAWVRT